MVYEDGMTHEELTSDGRTTIGYVNGKPAQWDADLDMSTGDEFSYVTEGSTFGTHNQIESIVVDGAWNSQL